MNVKLDYIVHWQIKGPICNFVNCSGETKEEREKFNPKPKKGPNCKIAIQLQ